MKKTIIVVFTIFALMGMVDLVDASRGSIYAEAATRKAAKKTKKAVAKKATTAKVVSLDASSPMSKLIRGEYLEKHGCWKGSLTATVRVSGEVTVIVTKTGKTANTGVTLKKGTQVKVFVKQAAQRSAPKVTASQKDRQEAPAVATSRKGVVAMSNRYALEFAALVPHQGKVVDGSLITCEQELALIGRGFTRDTRVTGRFSVKLERALTVRASAMDVIVYPSKGGAYDARDGETLKKGTIVTIWLKSQAVSTFAPATSVAAPVAAKSDVESMPALTAEQQLAQRAATYAAPAPAPQAQPAPSKNPEFEGFKEQQGFALSPSGLWGDFRIVREEFVVSDTTVVRQRLANGKWRTLEPGTRVTEGWQNVRVFANAVK